MKKLLVVGVIVLFLGLACAPSINANVSTESELVEITTEICGLDGGKYTVQLTQKEAEEVDRLFENIRHQLNESTSREEAEEIFNDAIVELDKYGLLGGLSVKQAQRLITCKFRRYMKIKLFTDRIFENKGIYENGNVLCLVSGELKESHAYSFLGMLLDFLIKEGFNGVIVDILYLFSFFRSILLPLPILFANGISMGRFVILPVGGEEKYIPAEGWINTYGLFGVKKWEGNNIYGQLFPFPLFIVRGDDFIGINGFTGFRFQYKSLYDNCFYFGYALMVNIDYKKPSFS